MKVTAVHLLFLFLCFSPLNAQQTSNQTTYLFSALSFNPAYAGSKEYLSTNFVHRSQWLNWSNNDSKAPSSQLMTLHAPVGDRVGVGLNLQREVAGVRKLTQANLAYAYKIKLPVGVLSAGLQGGVVNWRANWGDLTFEDGIENDPAFSAVNPSFTRTNFGAGIYFEAEKYYAGLSFPRLLDLDISSTSQDVTTTAQLYRQLYFMAGGIIPILSNSAIFKPSILIRKVGTLGKGQPQSDNIATPTSIDLDASILFAEKFWLGLSYRMTLEGSAGNDSIDVWAAFYLNRGVRLGFGYDFSVSPLRDYNSGSLEILLGYDLNYKVDTVVNPRYF